MKKEKGLVSIEIGSYTMSSHGDVKYSIGNTVNNTVMTLYGVRWVLDLLGWSLCKYINV